MASLGEKERLRLAISVQILEWYAHLCKHISLHLTGMERRERLLFRFYSDSVNTMNVSEPCSKKKYLLVTPKRHFQVHRLPLLKFLQNQLQRILRVVVQSVSRVQLFVTPWTAAYQVPLSFTISQSLLKFMSFESVTLSNNLIFCCLLLLPLVFPSIRGFSKELALPIRWPKFWGISFSNSLSNEYSGLIFFWIDWLDLLAVQETLKHLLQHHNSKVKLLQWFNFLYDLTLTSIHVYGKNHNFDYTTFVNKVISKLFNSLSLP